jgi:hypothetical protein
VHRLGTDKEAQLVVTGEVPNTGAQDRQTKIALGGGACRAADVGLGEAAGAAEAIPGLGCHDLFHIDFIVQADQRRLRRLVR